MWHTVHRYILYSVSVIAGNDSSQTVFKAFVQCRHYSDIILYYLLNNWASISKGSSYLFPLWVTMCPKTHTHTNTGRERNAEKHLNGLSYKHILCFLPASVMFGGHLLSPPLPPCLPSWFPLSSLVCYSLFTIIFPSSSLSKMIIMVIMMCFIYRRSRSTCFA